MKIISIDPSSGSKNGVCIKNDGIIISVQLLTSLQVIELLNKELPDVLILEDSRLNGIYGNHSRRRVGVLDGICKLYELQCNMLNIKLIKIRPCGLNNIAEKSFPPAYKEYENLQTDCKVAILLHDCVKFN
jgi:hypothetical protein